MEENNLRLLKITETAKQMGIGVNRVHELINDRKLGFIAIGKKKRIPILEIQRYIKDSVQYSESNSLDFIKPANEQEIISSQLNSLEIFNKLKEK